MKEEIFYGIKNAIERGSSLEAAAQSFMNSGYNPDEVREAVSMISQGATNIVQSVSKPEVEKEKSFPVDSKTASPDPVFAGPSQTSSAQNFQSTGKSNKGLIIALVVILLILVGGIIAFLLFENQIIAALKNLI